MMRARDILLSYEINSLEWVHDASTGYFVLVKDTCSSIDLNNSRQHLVEVRVRG